MRYVKGRFVLTGPNVPSMRFKSRREARDSMQAAYPARRSRRAEGMRRGGQLGHRRKANESNDQRRSVYIITIAGNPRDYSSDLQVASVGN
jgi:hypothetical protein